MEHIHDEGLDIQMQETILGHDVENLEPENENLSSETGESAAGPRRPKRVNQPVEKRTRKRKVNKDKWKCNTHKAAVQSGAEHFSKSGKFIPAKAVQPSCGTSCRFKCSSRVTEEERRRVHSRYWKIYGQQGKWNWHARHVKTFDKKSNNEKETRRKCSRHYFFTIKGKEVKVCQTMYLSTLDISDGSVITSYKKIGPDGALSPDKRGQFKTRRPRQISEHLKDSVREHISMFPRVEAHYIRSTTNREYLDPTLNIQKMHSMYLEWVVEQEEYVSLEKPANYRQYLL